MHSPLHKCHSTVFYSRKYSNFRYPVLVILTVLRATKRCKVPFIPFTSHIIHSMTVVGFVRGATPHLVTVK